MPFQLSPGVAVVEKDFSSIIPAVATSTGAFAGAFQWGPINEPVTVSSENVLVQRFGKPSDSNAQSFFTAANFLSYANNLLVVRADTAGARNAVATQSGTVTSTAITAGGSYSSTAAAPSVTFGTPNIAGGIRATGTAVLSGGAITAIAVSGAGTGYTSAPNVVITAPSGGTGATFTVVMSGSSPNMTVSSITVTAGGSGYKGTVTASLTGGGGSGASLGTVTVASSTISSITIVNHGTGYTSAPSVTFGSGAATATATVTVGGIKIKNTDDYLDNYSAGEGVSGEFAAKYPGTIGNSIKISMVDGDQYSGWDYENEFDGAPGTSPYATQFGGMDDEMHIIIIDEDGAKKINQ